MHLNTCTGCKFKGVCDHAAHLRAAIKGHGIRSVKFSCAEREPVFRPGDPAIFTTYISDPDEEHRCGVEEVSFAGVVIDQRGSKVIGFIKPDSRDIHGEVIFEAKGNGYVKMPIKRVRPDPSREPVEIKTCRWCASNYAIDGRCNRDTTYTPSTDCLKALAETPPQGGTDDR
ncbi:MAG: hypothetical protein ACK4NE_07865 [Albidovulum sp.]